MRQLFMAGMILAMVGVVRANVDDPVKCKADGVHLCCGNCDKAVRQILGKVDGLSNVKVDRQAADKVTFEAKSQKEANDALAALVKGGFCCEVTAGDKKITPAKTMVNLKGDELTIVGAHMCCNACINAAKKLFPNATVTVTGDGIIRDVNISGKNLDGQTVIDTFQKGGFNGTVQAKK
jgi:periplasmic mercuric ion binding protein